MTTSTKPATFSKAPPVWYDVRKRFEEMNNMTAIKVMPLEKKL